MGDTSSRRRFLGRGAELAGALAIAGRLTPGFAFADSATDALVDKAVGFLKGRQEANGGWSTTRKEPGITAPGRDGPAPVEAGHTRRAGRHQGAWLPRTVHWPQGGPFRGGARQLLDVDRAHGLPGGEHRRQVRPRDQGRAGLPQVDAVGRRRRASRTTTPSTAGPATAARTAVPTSRTPPSSWRPCETRACRPTTPRLQKALVFVSRCQNLKSEFNDQPWADKVNDGGFIYTAANGGVEHGRQATDNGGLRSYASMTYAGLKSMIYAGLTRRRPAGQGRPDLHHQALHARREPRPGPAGPLLLLPYLRQGAWPCSASPTLTDASGKVHDWRAELVAALAKRQNPDGSWVNPADRFMEGDPNLVTAYGLLALAYSK